MKKMTMDSQSECANDSLGESDESGGDADSRSLIPLVVPKTTLLDSSSIRNAVFQPVVDLSRVS